MTDVFGNTHMYLLGWPHNNTLFHDSPLLAT